MTGLEEVKAKVMELMQLQLGNWERESRGERALDVPLHRVFFGSPGTGKTTVAIIYGALLKRFGYLSNGAVVVKGPADFISDVIGGSEKKTIDVLESCKGKVLVIGAWVEGAYDAFLAPGVWGEGNSPGGEGNSPGGRQLTLAPSHLPPR